MKKLFAISTIALSIAMLSVSCKESPKDKVKDGFEEVGEGIEDAAEETGDAVEDGYEETKEEVHDATH
ncbi:hypothetical protein ACXGQW_11125 [Wenyingzhuangia sp. IMCC45533]